MEKPRRESTERGSIDAFVMDGQLPGPDSIKDQTNPDQSQENTAQPDYTLNLSNYQYMGPTN
jgi:hypothetical protein